MRMPRNVPTSARPDLVADLIHRAADGLHRHHDAEHRRDDAASNPGERRRRFSSAPRPAAWCSRSITLISSSSHSWSF